MTLDRSTLISSFPTSARRFPCWSGGLVCRARTCSQRQSAARQRWRRATASRTRSCRVNPLSIQLDVNQAGSPRRRGGTRLPRPPTERGAGRKARSRCGACSGRRGFGDGGRLRLLATAGSAARSQGLGRAGALSNPGGVQVPMRAACMTSFRRADRRAHGPELRQSRGDVVLIRDAD